MPVVKNMMIRAGADFSAITTESKKASSSMQNMASSISKSCSTLKKALGAIGIGFSIAAIVRAGKAAAEAYDQQAEAQTKLARTMKNTMRASNAEIQSILDLAEAQQKLGVVGDEVTVAGAQQLAGYLKTSAALQDLIPLMNDMATAQYGYDISAEQASSVAQVLGKAMNGQTTALKRYGFTLSEAQQRIMEYGNEAQRAAVLTEVVGARVSGMNAALADTPTGRMKQLANAISDIKESFGQAVRTVGTVFLPVLNTVAKILAAVATLANKVAQTIAKVFGGKVAGKEWQYIPPAAVSEIEEASEATESLGESTTQAGRAAQEAQEKFQQASFDTLHILEEASKSESTGSPTGSPTGSTTGSGDADTGIREIETASEEAGEGIGWLQDLLEKLKKKWEEFKSGLDLSKLKDAFGRLKEAFAPLAEDIGKGLEWLYEHVLKPLATWTINELAPRLVDLLANAFKLLHAVLQVLGPVLEAIWPILKWLAELAGFLITAAIDELSHAIEMMTRAINGDLSPLEKFQVLLQTLSAITLAGLIGGLGGLASAAGGAAAAAGGLAGIIGGGAAASGVSTAGALLGGIGAGGLIASLMSGSTAVGGFAASLTGTAVPALTAGTAAASTAATGFAAIAAPVAAVVAIIVALGIAIYECVVHFDEIKVAAAKAVDALKQAWNKVGEWFVNTVYKPIVETGKEVWENVQKWAANAAEGVRERWNGVKSFFIDLWDSVQTAGTRAWKSIQEFGVAAWASISQAWGRSKIFFEENVFEPLVSSARAGVEKIKSIFTGVAEQVGAAVQKVKDAIRKFMDIGDQLPSGFSLRNLTISGLIDKIKSIRLPGLAEGAVIPPNREFAAVLGDQSNGLNIEAPERLLRKIVRDEVAMSNIGSDSPASAMSGAIREGGSTGRMLRMLDRILDAIEEGHELSMDGYNVGRVTRRSLTMQARASG